jgi:hypothetical protein
MYVPHTCRNGCKVICSKDKTGEPCPKCGSPLKSLRNVRSGGANLGDRIDSGMKRLYDDFDKKYRYYWYAAVLIAVIIVAVCAYIFSPKPS